jgi:hypothetical protein
VHNFWRRLFAELRRHAQHKHRYAEEFSFSINMLDRAIEDVFAKEDEETREQILTKLPDKYQNFADMFSKSESSILPSYRFIDHKVELSRRWILPMGRKWINPGSQL